MPPTTRPRFRSRRFAALLTAVSFVILLVSGVLCFLAPKGRVAHELDWKVLGLQREEWIALHLTASVLFLVIALLHVFINWKALLKYLRTRPAEPRRVSFEAVAALVLGAVLVAGTLAQWPVFRDLVSWRDSIKHGVVEDSGDQPQASIAPGTERGGRQSRGGGGNQGFGRQTLTDLCAQEKVELEPILDRLAARGFVATGETSLRDLADWLGVPPRDVAAVVLAE